MRPRSHALPAYEPQLATLVASAPEGDFVHELKYDGYRIGCALRDGEVQLLSRRGKDWTAAFPELVESLRMLRVKSALLDGEVVIVQPDGRTSFQALQNSFSGGSRHGLTYFVFDLLHLDGRDLRGLSLRERKAELARLLARAPSRVKYAEHVDADGARTFARACALGAEGIVSKRASGVYHPGRTREWQKVKCVLRQEFVVGGFTEPEGARVGIGALLLGTYDGDRLLFAGKVGTGKGLNGATLRSLRKELEALETATCPFAARPAPRLLGKAVHFTRPTLVVEVAFGEWTDDGRVRHASLQGVRRDKDARAVTREVPRAQAARRRKGA